MPTRLRSLLAGLLGLTLAACTLTPAVDGLQPKSAADCPGQKACGWRCVDVDDPAAGCTATSCEPCPAGGPQTAPACGEGQACTTACLPGFADCTGAPGCETPVADDPDNCGACGHACAGGAACQGGTCQVAVATEIPSTGEAPRGLGVAGDLIAWSIDPAVQGGVAPRGEVRWADRTAPGAVTGVTGVGHPTWVRAAGGRWVAAATIDPDGYTSTWLYDTQAAVLEGRSVGFMHADNVVVGLALTPDWVFSAENPWNEGWSEPYGANPAGSGINTFVGDFAPLHAVGEGAGFLWLGSDVGVSRLEAVPDSGYDVVGGGGVYFDALAAKPVPGRVAARGGPTPSDPLEVYFADLTDGSVWMGRTTGPTATPWRLVMGDGPRTQMDLVADEAGAYWSDLDRGEIWAIERGGPVRRVAAGVRPWALALTPSRLYWTEVGVADGQVKSIPR